MPVEPRHSSPAAYLKFAKMSVVGTGQSEFGQLLWASFLIVTPSHLYGFRTMIRKVKSGEYRLYSRKKNPRTGKRRNLGTFPSLEKAKAHERAVQFFKRH